MKRPDQILAMAEVGALPKSELKDDVGLVPLKIGAVTKLVQKNGVLNVAILNIMI
jgi:hypothetical protein